MLGEYIKQVMDICANEKCVSMFLAVDDKLAEVPEAQAELAMLDERRRDTTKELDFEATIQMDSAPPESGLGDTPPEETKSVEAIKAEMLEIYSVVCLSKSANVDVLLVSPQTTDQRPKDVAPDALVTP